LNNQLFDNKRIGQILQILTAFDLTN